MQRAHTSYISVGITVFSKPEAPKLQCALLAGMGGDRDGNPNVTHDVTRDVCIIARLEAVDAYFKAVEQLMFELSVWRSNDELKEYAERIIARDARSGQR